MLHVFSRCQRIYIVTGIAKVCIPARLLPTSSIFTAMEFLGFTKEERLPLPGEKLAYGLTRTNRGPG
jgi:hypothetical protein